MIATHDPPLIVGDVWFSEKPTGRKRVWQWRQEFMLLKMRMRTLVWGNQKDLHQSLSCLKFSQFLSPC
jgi:hypothetical protein